MYVLKILSDFEFDSLPFKDVKEALGCANPKTGTAYVRHTGIKPLDAMVADHELDELVNTHSEHEDSDGIRYKKAREVFRNPRKLLSVVAPMLAGLLTGGLGFFGGGPIASGIAGAGAGALSAKSSSERAKAALFGGISGAAAGGVGKGAVEGFQKAGEGFLSKAGGTLKGAFGIGVGGPTTATTAGTGVGGGGLPQTTLGQTTPLLKPPLGEQLATTGVKTLPGFGGGPGPAVIGAGTTATQPAVAGGGFFSSQLGRTVAGAAIPSIGGALGPQAKGFDPMQSELFQEVLERTRTGTQVELTPEQEQSIISGIDSEEENTLKSVRQRFQSLRPGSDIASDTDLQQAIRDVEEDFTTRRTNALAGARLGITQQQTSQLAELAQLDVFALAQKAGISTQEAQNFHELLAKLGIAMATPPGQFNMFGGGLPGFGGGQ